MLIQKQPHAEERAQRASRSMGRRHRARGHPSRRPCGPPQRLCRGSSDLPWLFISEDGVEDGEQLMSDSDRGGHLGLTAGNQPLVEGFQYGIVLLCRLSAEEEGGSYGGPATANAGLTL